ncbi:choice-of-anchor R domain-containing protein [Ideonella paludis]|uniref:Uncharacterized protein n=1 Tax=Ideonella paludis TaxID=1233411 RepID=A0ABS5DTJ4_9BURK|nr:choice-of-anchor R domain-containing protein [Ideonella paludis]MBQ0934453.1 hypothetical protein [Ideonella paludis]
MTKKSRTFGAILVAVGICGSALATNAAATEPQQRPREVTHQQGLEEFVNTFNPNAAWAYDGGAFGVSGVDSMLGREHAAMAFNPSKSYAVKAITVAVGYQFGTNGATVSLNSDAAGAPGAVLYQAAITDLPNLGTCCVTSMVKVKRKVNVTAGNQYWIVVKTGKKTADTGAGWNLNSIGAVGTFAVDFGDGWQVHNGQTAAYSVSGTRLR